MAPSCRFKYAADAPTSSIDVANFGNVGPGITTPDKDLDIEGSGPALRLTDNVSSREWDMRLGPTNGRLVFRCGDDGECISKTGVIKDDLLSRFSATSAFR